MNTGERSPWFHGSFPLKEFHTPSTNEKSEENDNHPMEPEVQEFGFTCDLFGVQKMMEKASLQEKENEKYITDRYIPIRKTVRHRPERSQPESMGPEKTAAKGQQINQNKITLDEMYKMVILQPTQEKVLNFADHMQKNDHAYYEAMFESKSKKLLTSSRQLRKKGSEYRKINKTPYKVLDAPNMQDDFYLNLLEWSSKNILSVALESSLYFWNGNNNRVIRFCDIQPCLISSVTWNEPGTHIAVGSSQGVVDIWDVGKNRKIDRIQGHASRVSSLAWSSNLLATGARDKNIYVRDVRENSKLHVSSLQGHTQEVCGLKWSSDGHSLASGGNDNKLFVWSIESKCPIYKFSDHSAAVKGLAWNPHNHGVLASGGGSADRTIKFWNTLDGTLIDSFDTGSQVCNLMFSKTTKELVSTHGYSNHEIIIWKYPTLQKVTTLMGHSSRVLYLSMSPSGESIVTGAGDETLRFWHAFPEQKQPDFKPNILSTLELR